jgi:hypothetical protein
MIYCTRKLSFIGSHNSVTLRSLKKYNKEDFQASLLSTDWNPVLLSDNVNEAWDRFKEIFLSVINTIASVKQIRLKQRTEPWIDSDILQAISDRDSGFKIIKCNRRLEKFNLFKGLRKKVQYLVHSAKSSYFTTKLENKNDSKSLWKSLKNLELPSKEISSSSSSNICLKKL